MKKFSVLLALLLAFTLVLGGCSSDEEFESENSPFSVDTSVDNQLYIYANGASAGDGGYGMLTFGEEEGLFYECGGEEGEQLTVTVVPYDGESETLNFDDDANILMILELDGGSSGLIAMEPGEYALKIDVTSDTFTGTASIRVFGEDEGDTMIPNPWSDAENLEELESALGFGIEVPETLGELVVEDYYSYAPDMQMAEVRYAEIMEDGSHWMKGTIRKAPVEAVDPSESFSGVWDEYDGIYEVMEGVMFSYKDDMVYQAEWEKDGYHYSIFHQDGLDEFAMINAVTDVK